MLLDCFASCTRCLTPRRESRAVDKGKGTTRVPVSTPTEVAAEDTNFVEPPFQIEVGFFTNTGDKTTIKIKVTVDYSMPVNVVTNKCLVEKLGFPAEERCALPPELSKLAAQACIAPCGCELLSVLPSRGSGTSSYGDLSYARDFVIVGDDYHCELLLGRDFLGLPLELEAGPAGFHPNFTDPPKSKEEREKKEKEDKAKQAEQAAAAAARALKAKEYLAQLRKKDPKSGDGAGQGTAA